jgi:hypothetical protein
MSIVQRRGGRGSGLFEVSDRTAKLLRTIAMATATAGLLSLGLLALFGWMPRNPEGDWLRRIEQPAAAGLLLVLAVGIGVSRRWTAVAAVLIALGGTGAAVLAAIAYPPTVALAVAVGFLVPAVLLWVVWQRRETWGRIAFLAAGTAALLLGAWYAADATYQHFFGPAHPESETEAVDDPLVEWAWAGGVGPREFNIAMKPATDARSVRVTVGTTRQFDDESSTTTVEAGVIDGVARLPVDGLEPSTEYQYRFAVDGVPATEWIGIVRTLAGDASGELVIALSSCARSGSNGEVFDEIRRARPDLYLITGDMHYSNISRNDVDAFDRAYDTVLTSPAQAALYRSAPVAYVWDDHDYSGNDGDSSAASRPAARASYARNVPHYELASETTINQAFSLDGVRLVMLDTRSAREPGSTMLGDEQLRWLKEELMASSPTHDLVVVVSPTPWIGEASSSSDSWAGFADERAEIAQLVADHELDNLMIVSGDAHMVAIDDGTNSDYSSVGGAAIPVLQAAALDRPGNVKGGPYSEGTFPGAGQFGLIRVQRTGDDVQVTLEGHRYDGETFVSWQFDPGT